MKKINHWFMILYKIGKGNKHAQIHKEKITGTDDWSAAVKFFQKNEIEHDHFIITNE